jgi:DNA-binding response OmpR family regulator
MAIIPVIEGYDIILTDLRLTKEMESSFDGFYIIRTIRDIHIKVPILVISGRDDITRIQSAFEIGANDYIIK